MKEKEELDRIFSVILYLANQKEPVKSSKMRDDLGIWDYELLRLLNKYPLNLFINTEKENKRYLFSLKKDLDTWYKIGYSMTQPEMYHRKILSQFIKTNYHQEMVQKNISNSPKQYRKMLPNISKMTS